MARDPLMKPSARSHRSVRCTSSTGRMCHDMHNQGSPDFQSAISIDKCFC